MPSEEPVRMQIAFEPPHVLKLASQDVEYTFTYARAGNMLVLDGTWAKSPVHVVLCDRAPPVLETRGFHCVKSLNCHEWLRSAKPTMAFHRRDRA